LRYEDAPTAEQIAVLHTWSSKHGRTWKSKLREAWMTGDYDGFEGSRYLQQIRNTFGPSWMTRVKFSPAPIVDERAFDRHVHR
jgi:hypothetical protein